MVVKTGTTLSEGSLEGKLTEQGRFRGGSALLLADRWFDFAQDLDGSISAESQDGLAKEVLDYVSANSPSPKFSKEENELQEPRRPRKSDYLEKGGEEAELHTIFLNFIRVTILIVIPAVWWLLGFWWALFALFAIGLLSGWGGAGEKKIIQNSAKAFKKDTDKYNKELAEYKELKRKIAADQADMDRRWRELWSSKVCSRCGCIYREPE